MHSRTGKAATSAPLFIAIIALAVAVFGVFYRQQVSLVRDSTTEQEDLYRRMTGLDNPAAKNSLDRRYTDADGDLIADAPSDPSKQIDPPTLRFTYVAVEDDAEFRTAFKELIAALSRATGKPVEFVSYSNVEDKLRDLRDGKLQISGLNTGSVPIGVCTAGFVPVCELGDANGQASYHMQIITTPKSPISKLTDIRGHELALTEPNSNSGYKAPLVRLRENGLRPPTDYLIRYSQGHVQSIAGIRSKTFEAAAVADDVLKREVAEGHIATSNYKVIFTSDATFPSAAIGYTSILKPELAEKIKSVLLNFDWKGTGLEKAFAAEGRVKFVPADYKKQWDFVPPH